MEDYNDFLKGGKFIKQYFLKFPDGKKMHAWIYIKDNSKLIYGHKINHTNGRDEFYDSEEERDFFDLPELESKVTMSLGMVAFQANAKMRVLEFSPNVDLDDQMKTMKDIGAEGFSDVVDSQKRNKEIKNLELLYNGGRTMKEKKEKKIKEDTSSVQWLSSRIQEWERSNKDKGRIVEFFGSFFAVDPENDCEVKNDRVFAFGLKKTILNTLKDISKEIRKEKEDFVNW
jgi:hypothetical protein